MAITSIRLQKYRSYSDESFEFDDGVNIIVGPNGSGKTNLLEAILVACKGSSYRVADDELIAFGEPWARIDLQAVDSKRIVKFMRVQNERTQKQFEIDGRMYKRLPSQKTKPIVLFEPNHLSLLHGSPEHRRNFLDDLLEQVEPGFGTLRRQYRRTLAQRNALLKQAGGSDLLFAWNIRLSELGGQVAVSRQRLVTHIEQRIGEMYSSVAQAKNRVSVTYKTTCEGEYASMMLRRLEATEQRDIHAGFTTTGPHRDDLYIQLNEHAMSSAASRGETRTMLLALKMIELVIVEEARGTRPVLLLDDVFSELDGARRQALTKSIAGYQTFLTTTDADVVVQHFMDQCRIIPLGG